MVDPSADELGYRGVVIRLDGRQELLDRAIIAQISVRVPLGDPAYVFRSRREDLQVGLADRVHTVAENRGVEPPQMYLGNVVIERHHS